MKKGFPEIGDVIGGRYALRKRLGRGGFGVVYAANDRLLGELVAVKVLSDERELLTRRRIWREAAVLRLLDLPGVVQLRDQGIDEGRYFLVMTLAKGTPFPGKGITTWEEMAPRVRSFLSVLALLHEQGIIHGDLKPGNVLADEDGQVTLLDFGVAQTQEWEQGEKPGLVRGTAGYIAPEIWQGKPASPASDIFAVGVIIYESLHGERLYRGDSVSEVMRRILTEPVPNMRFGMQGIPAEIRSLLGSMLAKYPDWRPANAAVALDFFDKPQGAGWWGKEEFGPLKRLMAREDRIEMEEMKGLFGGREELFAAQSGAAEELWRRTLGEPARVVAELEDWVERRLARIQGERLVLKTGALQRLRAGARISSQKGIHSGSLPEEPQEREMLRWLMLMHPERDWEALERFTGQGRESIEAAAKRFESDGHLPPEDEEDAYRPAPQELFAEWDRAQREEAHSKVAAELPRGHRRRFFHLTRAGEAVEAAREAINTAVEFDRKGDTERAVGMLQEAWLALRGEGPEELQRQLMTEWVKIALAIGEPGQIERALVALERVRELREEVRPLEELLRAALLVTQAGGESALEALSRLEGFSNQNLELRRHMYRLQAAGNCGLERFQEVLKEIEEWSGGVDCREVQGTVLSWKGKESYRNGDFERAAELQMAAAQRKDRLTARLSSLLGAALAHLEANQLEEARRIAEEVYVEARRNRQPKYIARAKYTLRAIAYRMGTPLAPDPGFVEALEELGVTELLGLTLLNEAASAMRRGDRENARRCSLRATIVWGRSRNIWANRLARALAIHCGEESDWLECAGLVEKAEACPFPRVGAQIVGLLASSIEVMPPSARAFVSEVASKESEEGRKIWREVLSLGEALEAVNRVGQEKADYSG